MTEFSEQDAITIENLLKRLDHGWNELHTYLKTLSEEQRTKPTDAAGWTVKDHVMHLAVWEDGINALLDKKSRREAMGLEREVWKSEDYDAMNDVIFQRHKDNSWDEVMQMFNDIHQRLIEKVKSLQDEDLMRPYNYYQPGSSGEHPVIGSIAGNTFGHYEEHCPWMEAIANS